MKTKLDHAIPTNIISLFKKMGGGYTRGGVPFPRGHTINQRGYNFNLQQSHPTQNFKTVK